MRGVSIPFQDYAKELADKLANILKSSDEACLVGLPGLMFKWPTEESDYTRDWMLKNRMYFLDFLSGRINLEKEYIAAGFTCYYMGRKDGSTNSLELHYEKKKRLFEGKRLVIFAGDHILSGLSHNVFERAKSIEIVHCPKKNAFSVYSQIMDKARSYPMEGTVLGFILGPTATALAWELSMEGYLAWDFGHIAKDYDAYCKQIGNTEQDSNSFFAPD